MHLYGQLYFCLIIASCELKTSVVECQSIPSIDTCTLDQPLINTWSTLHRHLVDISVNIWSVDPWPTIDQVSIKKYWRNLSTRMSFECWSRGQLMVLRSIDQHSTMDAFSTCMIQIISPAFSNNCFIPVICFDRAVSQPWQT